MKSATIYKKVLPPIGNKCRQFCTSLVQSLYYVPDSYFRSEGVLKRDACLEVKEAYQIQKPCLGMLEASMLSYNTSCL
jgi:hypothetical protein